jgi:hypothetical protein
MHSKISLGHVKRPPSVMAISHELQKLISANFAALLPLSLLRLYPPGRLAADGRVEDVCLLWESPTFFWDTRPFKTGSYCPRAGYCVPLYSPPFRISKICVIDHPWGKRRAWRRVLTKLSIFNV